MAIGTNTLGFTICSLAFLINSIQYIYVKKNKHLLNETLDKIKNRYKCFNTYIT